MRGDEGLAEPPKSLVGFPSVSFEPSKDLFRAVTPGNGVWWFGYKGDQRFDLYPPNGTCYVATDQETAIREKLRRRILGHGLTPDVVKEIEVHRLHLPRPGDFANTGHQQAARHGVSRELSTTTDYSLTREWAVGFFEAKLDGIYYASRFTSEMACNALAVFDGWKEKQYGSEGVLVGLQAVRAAKMDDLLPPAMKSKRATIRRPPIS